MIRRMPHLTRFALLITLAMTIAGVSVGQASAQSQVPDLEASVTGHDPLRPTLQLKNITTTACQVATTAQGTVAVTKLSQDGKVLQPMGTATSSDEDIGFFEHLAHNLNIHLLVLNRVKLFKSLE